MIGSNIFYMVLKQLRISMKRLSIMTVAAICLLCIGACSETEHVFMSPEISDVIEVESNLSHKGDICWFTIGYRAAAIGNSSPKYGRIKYLIEIEGEEPAGPVEIGSKDVLNALSRDILSSHPEYRSWWKSKYYIDMPENIIFFTVPANYEANERRVEVKACISGAEAGDDKWDTIFSAMQDGVPVNDDDRTHELSIPLEFPRPYGNLLVCDIDKERTWIINCGEEFEFEVLDRSEYEDENRTPVPVSEYKEEFLTVSMSGKRTCIMTLSRQEKPYRTLRGNYLIVYNSQNEVIEKFALLVGENFEDMEF